MNLKVQEHWAMEYIGKPWVRGMAGPNEFDCWGLLCWIYRVHFKKDVPMIDLGVNHPKVLMRAFKNHPEKKRWRRVSSPLEGDALLMSYGKSPFHIGVYLDLDGGGVLHSLENVGVIYQSIKDLELSGLQIKGIYRLKS